MTSKKRQDTELEKCPQKIDQIWQLSDILTVQQAAALLAGYDPTNVCFGDNGEPQGFKNEHGPYKSNQGINRVTGALTTLVNAINGSSLPALIGYSATEYGTAHKMADLEITAGNGWFPGLAASNTREGEVVSPNGSCFYKPHPDWSLTTIDRQILVEWLQLRGHTEGFFFTKNDPWGFRDPTHPRYAPKLAASVAAWQSVTNPGKESAKKALTTWLGNNTDRFGLGTSKSETSAIGQCAKVANWQPEGGAPPSSG